MAAERKSVGLVLRSNVWTKGPVMRFATFATIVCLAIVGCTGNGTSRYAVFAAQIGDVRDVVPATGTLKAERQVEVGSETSGRVVDVLVEANEVVRRGQVLARVRPDRLALDLEGARAEVAAAQAALVQERARAVQVERRFANQTKLSESGFISPAALGQAESEADAARASVDRAEADVSRAAIRVRSAEQSLSELEIRAPIDGVVLSRDVEVGQLVSPTTEVPLFVVVSGTRTLLVESMVSEADIARVDQVVGVIFTVEAYPGRTFRGHVKQILRSPVQDRKFVSYPVIIEVENAEGLLLPGMTASVEFVHADARQVLRVPIEALYFVPPDYTPVLSEELSNALKRRGVLNREAMIGAELGMLIASGRERLFVMEGGRTVSRGVRVGAQSPEHVEIVDGLRPGENVVVGSLQTNPRSGG